MSSIRSVTVYCSSSSTIARAYFEAAESLGGAIAREGWLLVYGGNLAGTMAAVANAARSAGGKVVGITPQLMVDKGIADPDCYELLVTSCMRERKQLMEQRGDAFVTLPGGLGTFEELFEIIVGKVLGYHNKPIVILNVNGYYDPLVRMIEHGVEQQFIKAKSKSLYFVAESVAEAMEYLRNYHPPTRPADDWLVKGEIGG